ncbi:acetyl-CoA carboxylase carboxyltransferase subunit beta /acetyl-CoA carboxylase carboxyltransferase subunit alpha [Lentzea atacamensis]|uniref:Acetyl-CoA carboxylase carboxyltransferase subunit beta /acetyl-CoA carboxylase carboxyltransferase subunit alpha n=1 Tax=Lentzea atacamensis TaxID=531938 RepID=A0A316I3I4_9PSEU|nr:acyl-CoA carboxylase subunit beta [Lentzea atacamensis]PWK86967.1 acetyl-CoA carboxylase carboxyltransferase subunit beta /acetyl-CoA carboxylase carboxyltransferase subunit alpha [Lentzea atacamensis]
MTDLMPPITAPDTVSHVLADESAAARCAALAELKETRRRTSDDRATRRQHERGKLTVHERLELLLDEGSFRELQGLRRHQATGFGLETNRPHSDGVVTGWGTVDGRTVCVYAHDFRIMGGSLGAAHAAKVHRLMDMAETAGVPLISLNDSAGARIQEGVAALNGYGGIFVRNVRSSGVIPQISVILGPCAGGAAYSPALTDLVFMVRRVGQMFLTGPDVVSAVTGERVTTDELGGADTHGTFSGVAQFVHDDEATCLQEVRRLITFLPDNNQTPAPAYHCTDPIDRPNGRLVELVPTDPSRCYDMLEVVEEIVDDADFLQVHEDWARNVLCGFARIGGQTVGIVANQPLHLAGVLDIHASEKAARFVCLCDAFNIPLLTLVDVPGFLPGVDQERGGIIRHGAKLLHAYCAATVPRIQLIIRKAYGGAYIVMDSPAIGSDLALAWPTNEIAVMGPEGAARVIFRRDITDAHDPEAALAHFTKLYRDELVHPLRAAELGYVDDVIDPRATRCVVADALSVLRTKKTSLPYRKHSITPL